MSQFAGKWKLHSSENFEEILKVFGAPWVVRKMVGNVNPKLEVTVDGDHYSIKTTMPMQTKVTEFTIGVEFEEETMDQQKYKCVVQREGDKLVEVSKHKDFDVKTTREVQGDEMIVTIQAKGVVAVRKFRRE